MWGGAFVLNVSGTPAAPVNDECPGTAIANLPFTDLDSTTWASNEGQVACDGSISNDVVYNLTLAESHTVIVSLCGSSFDTELEVRTGGECPGSSQVICNDNYCGYESQLTFNAEAGVAYYIFVGGIYHYAGLYLLNVTGQPLSAPDSLVIESVWPDIHLNWSAIPGVVSYNIYRATTSDVPPIPGNLWDTSPTNSYVDTGVLSTGASKYFYAVTAVYSGALLTSPADRNPDGMGASGR
jgi:hypothetical protein